MPKFKINKLYLTTGRDENKKIKAREFVVFDENRSNSAYKFYVNHSKIVRVPYTTFTAKQIESCETFSHFKIDMWPHNRKFENLNKQT